MDCSVAQGSAIGVALAGLPIWAGLCYIGWDAKLAIGIADGSLSGNITAAVFIGGSFFMFIAAIPRVWTWVKYGSAENEA